MFLEILQNSQENTSARDSFLINNFIKKETLVQAFFCEFCEISKNTYSYRTPLVAINCNYWWVLLMLRKKIILLCWYIAINCYYNLCLNFFISRSYTAQKLRFSIKDFLRISSHLLKKFLMENFHFLCSVINGRISASTVLQNCSNKKKVYVVEKKYGPETGPNKIQPALQRNFKIIFQKITSWRQLTERLGGRNVIFNIIH